MFNTLFVGGEVYDVGRPLILGKIVKKSKTRVYITWFDSNDTSQKYDKEHSKFLKLNIESLMKRLIDNLSDDLRKKPYKGSKNKLKGHSYIASEALNHLLGGKKSEYTPMFLKYKNQPHWFLKSKLNDEILDIAKKQFYFKVDYSKAIGKGFFN